jgi:sarcosine oxidase/L-pipecolate oxidase
MSNILKGKSDGEEKDTAWKWKSEEELQRRQGKEFGVSPRNWERKELSDYDDGFKSRL